jgi:hypothetical protein
MAGRRKQIDYRLAPGVGIERSRIAHGNYRTGHDFGRGQAVVGRDVGHGNWRKLARFGGKID